MAVEGTTLTARTILDEGRGPDHGPRIVRIREMGDPIIGEINQGMCICMTPNIE